MPCDIRRSTMASKNPWTSSSSSVSALRGCRSRRNRCLTCRAHSIALALLSEYLRDGGRYSLAILLLMVQLFPARCRQSVNLGAAAGIQFLPFSVDPAFLGEAVESRKERPGSNPKGAFCYLLDPIGDTNPMERPQF